MTAAAQTAGFDPRAFLKAAFKGDVALAVGVMAILAMLLMPMPSFLLDVALALSIAFSILILMTALFIKTPLEFTSFPAVLLVATLLRLALNIGTTRLILANGHEGPQAAGQVIAAFGDFVMGGSFVIGVIVFAILVIVNFIVISKGSSRIAEVAARFTLDAMPGKQMAIDADLSAGLITEEQAKQRRKDLEQESNFFGSMDGASKFVRGDAVAGLIITAINLVGGMLIGMMQHGLTFAEAGDSYSRLTIGDGLVSQIPALIISIGAGLLVSKAGVEGSADQAIGKQFSNYPQGLALVSAVCGLAAILPGMPFIPFALIAAGAGWGAWALSRRKDRRQVDAAAAAARAEAGPSEPVEEPISASLAIDDIKLELGYGLLPLINDLEGRRLTDQIRALRKQLATEMGFVMPQVRILDNLMLPQDAYAIRIKEMDAGEGRLKLRCLLAMDPMGARIDLPGEQVREPAFGLPAAWIDETLREDATFRGYTVVDPATVLATHLTEILKDHMSELLSFAGVERLLSDLPSEHKKLLDDITPSQITRSGLHRVLQTLLKERVSIRDLPGILEAVAEAAGPGVDLLAVTEHVRARLSRQLCWTHRGGDGALPILPLSPQWEQAFQEALIGHGSERQLALAPSKLQAFVADVRDAYEAAGRQSGDVPVLLTGPVIRPYVRSLVERFRPQTVVMSQNEIHPKARLRAVGTI